jgi:hypothetical protein
MTNKLPAQNIKTTWQIIHSEIGRQITHDAIQHLISHKKQPLLNDHFLTTVNTITNQVNNDYTDDNFRNTTQHKE